MRQIVQLWKSAPKIEVNRAVVEKRLAQPEKPFEVLDGGRLETAAREQLRLPKALDAVVVKTQKPFEVLDGAISRP